MPNVPARSRGFALLIVLWMLVLIAFVVAQMTAAGRTESRIAGNLAANSRSQAAADGAIYEAIFHVSDARPEQHWQVDGSGTRGANWPEPDHAAARRRSRTDQSQPCLGIAAGGLIAGGWQPTGNRGGHRPSDYRMGRFGKETGRGAPGRIPSGRSPLRAARSPLP